MAEQAPILCKNLIRAVMMERSRASILIGNLRARGVLRLTEDGYVLADPVWGTLARG